MTRVYSLSALSSRLYISKLIVHFRYSFDKTEHMKDFPSYLKVDAMKLGLKEMKKEYKKVNIDEIEVCLGYC